MKLELSVKRSKFRYDEHNSVESDTEYKKLKPIVLKKNDYRCIYCDYKSKKFQHIHHLDDNHSNNSESNLVVACPLCHMSNHIGFAGEKRMGKLIFLREDRFTQADLNNLVRHLWIAKNSKADQKMAITAIKVLERLDNMDKEVINRLGTNDLSILGDFLMSLSNADYKKRSEKLKNIYFLPSEKAFSKELPTWITNSKALPTNKWLSVANNKFGLILSRED